MTSIQTSSGSRVRASRRPRQKWNESYRSECLLPISARGRFDEREPLHADIVGIGERKHHTAARFEITEQRGRNVRRRCGDDDGVDDKILAEIGAAIAVFQANVPDLQRLQIAPRLRDERTDSFDRVDVLRDMRENRGLITASGADLENGV